MSEGGKLAGPGEEHPPAGPGEERPPAGPDGRPSAGPANTDLGEVGERVHDLHREAYRRHRIDPGAAVLVTRALAAALDATSPGAVPRPLVPAVGYDTVHCMNVGLLAMGLADHLAFPETEILAAGRAGLLHDIGWVLCDPEPGPAQGGDPAGGGAPFRGEPHTIRGARLLLDSGPELSLAAAVAYEHHLFAAGRGGYPELHFPRAPHRFSRLVAVCDVFDALRTERPHRRALSEGGALDYLKVLAGTTLDPELVTGLIDLASHRLPRIERTGTRPAAELAELAWLPDGGFDPDCEPRPTRL